MQKEEMFTVFLGLGIGPDRVARARLARSRVEAMRFVEEGLSGMRQLDGSPAVLTEDSRKLARMFLEGGVVPNGSARDFDLVSLNTTSCQTVAYIYLLES